MEEQKKEEKKRKLEEEKKAEENKKKEILTEKSIKKTIIIIVIILLGLTLSFVFKDQIINFVKEQAGTVFEYNGFKYEKFDYGGILMYKTTIYVVKYGKTIRYDLLLRNDPRELDKNINVDVFNKNLMSTAYFSLDSGAHECNKTILASWKIGEFLGALGINASGAATSRESLFNTSYVNDTNIIKTCKDAVNNESVIVLQKSPFNTSFISQTWEGETYKDCFVLNYNNCETVEVTERFILLFLEILKK